MASWCKSNRRIATPTKLPHLREAVHGSAPEGREIWNPKASACRARRRASVFATAD